MDDFKKELQQLNINEFKAGELVPVEYEGQYDQARLCGFRCGCGGCGGCGGFRCGCGGFRCGCGGFRCGCGGFRCGCGGCGGCGHHCAHHCGHH